MNISIYIFLSILIYYCYNNSIKHKSDLSHLYKNKNHTLFRDITLCAKVAWDTATDDINVNHVFSQIGDADSDGFYITKLFNINKKAIYELSEKSTSTLKALGYPRKLTTNYITKDDKYDDDNNKLIRTIKSIPHYTYNIESEGKPTKVVLCEPLNQWGKCTPKEDIEIGKQSDQPIYVDDCIDPIHPDTYVLGNAIIDEAFELYQLQGTIVSGFDKKLLDGIRISIGVKDSATQYGTTYFQVDSTNKVNMCHINHLNDKYTIFILNDIELTPVSNEPYKIILSTETPNNKGIVYTEATTGEKILNKCADDTDCPISDLFRIEISTIQGDTTQYYYIYYNQYMIGSSKTPVTDNRIIITKKQANNVINEYPWCFNNMYVQGTESTGLDLTNISYCGVKTIYWTDPDPVKYTQIKEDIESNDLRYININNKQIYKYIKSADDEYVDIYDINTPPSITILNTKTYTLTGTHRTYRKETNTIICGNNYIEQFKWGTPYISDNNKIIISKQSVGDKEQYGDICITSNYNGNAAFTTLIASYIKNECHYYRYTTNKPISISNNMRLSKSIGAGNTKYGTTYFNIVDGSNIDMCHISNMARDGKYHIIILKTINTNTLEDGVNTPYKITTTDMKVFEITIGQDGTIASTDKCNGLADCKTKYDKFTMEYDSTGKYYIYYDKYDLGTNGNYVPHISQAIYDEIVSKGYGWCFNDMFIVGTVTDNITYCNGNTKPWNGPPSALTQFSEVDSINKYINTDSTIYYTMESGDPLKIKTVYEYTKIENKQDIVNTMEYKHYLLYTYNDVDDVAKTLKIKNYEIHFGWGELKKETNIIAYLVITATPGGSITIIYTDKCVETPYENNIEWKDAIVDYKYYHYTPGSDPLPLPDDLLISKIDGAKYAFTTYNKTDGNKLCHVNKLNNEFRLFIFDLDTPIVTGSTSSPYTIQYTEIRQYDWDKKVKCTYDDGGSSTDNGCTKINLFKIEKNGDNLYYFYYDEYDLGNSTVIDDKNKPEINQEDVDKFIGFEWCFKGFTIKPPITSDEFPYCGKPKITWTIPISGGYLFHETLTRAMNTYKYLYPSETSGTIYEYILNNYNKDITIIEYKYNEIPSINANSNIAIFNTIKLNTYIISGEIYTKTIHSYNLLKGGYIGENKDFYISKTIILETPYPEIYSDICRQTDYIGPRTIDNTIITALGKAKYWTLTAPGDSNFNYHKNKRLSVDFGDNKYYTTYIQEEITGTPKKINMCSVTNINNKYQILIFNNIQLTPEPPTTIPYKIALNIGGTYILYEEEKLEMIAVCKSSESCNDYDAIYKYESNTTYAYLYYNGLQVGMTDNEKNKYKIPKTLSEQIKTATYEWCFTDMDYGGDMNIPEYKDCQNSITEWNLDNNVNKNEKFSDSKDTQYKYINTQNHIISEYNIKDKNIIEYIYEDNNPIVDNRVATYNTYQSAKYTNIIDKVCAVDNKCKKEVLYETLFRWKINELKTEQINIARIQIKTPITGDPGTFTTDYIYSDKCNKTVYDEITLPTTLAAEYSVIEDGRTGITTSESLNKIRLTINSNINKDNYATTIFYGSNNKYQMCHINNLNGIYTVIIAKEVELLTTAPPTSPESISLKGVITIYEENNVTHILKEICTSSDTSSKCASVKGSFTIEKKGKGQNAKDIDTYYLYLNKFYLGSNNKTNELIINQRYIDQLEDNLWCFIDMNIKQDNNNEGDNEDDEDDDNNGRFDNINNYNYYIIIIITYLFIFII